MLKTEVLIAFLFLTRLYEFFEGGNEPVFGGANSPNEETDTRPSEARNCLPCRCCKSWMLGNPAFRSSFASPRDNMNKS